MRKAALIAPLLALLATPGFAYDEGLNNDKFLHVVGGAAVAKYVTKQTGSRWRGCLASLAVGVAKEVSDHHFGGHVEAADIGATMMGCTFKFEF